MVDLMGAGFGPSPGIRTKRSLLTRCIQGLHIQDDTIEYPSPEVDMTRFQRKMRALAWNATCLGVERIALNLTKVTVAHKMVDVNDEDVTSGFLQTLAKWAGADNWFPGQPLHCLRVTPGLIDIFSTIHSTVILQLNELIELCQFIGAVSSVSKFVSSASPSSDDSPPSASWPEMHFLQQMATVRYGTVEEQGTQSIPDETSIGSLLKDLSYAAEIHDFEHPNDWRMDDALDIDAMAITVTRMVRKDVQVGWIDTVKSEAQKRRILWLVENQQFWCS
jgi:hypothetical protein